MYGENLSWFQRFLQRFQPTLINVVNAELKDAELAHLHMLSQAEYAELRLQTHKLTAEYHDKRAERLRAYLQMNRRVTALGDPEPTPTFRPTFL